MKRLTLSLIAMAAMASAIPSETQAETGTSQGMLSQRALSASEGEWGWFGLIGLLGLFGLKRRDSRHG